MATSSSALSPPFSASVIPRFGSSTLSNKHSLTHTATLVA
jgi:hypothetical protein